MVSVRHLESVLRMCWFDVNESQGGFWLLMAQLWRRAPELLRNATAAIAWFCVAARAGSTRGAKQAVELFLDQLQMIGGIHHSRYDYRSLSAFHQNGEWSSSPVCFVIPHSITRPCVESLLNQTVVRCKSIQMSWRKSKGLEPNFARWLGIDVVDASGHLMTAALNNLVTNRYSCSVSEQDLSIVQPVLKGNGYAIIWIEAEPESGQLRLHSGQRSSAADFFES